VLLLVCLSGCAWWEQLLPACILEGLTSASMWEGYQVVCSTQCTQVLCAACCPALRCTVLCCVVDRVHCSKATMALPSPGLSTARWTAHTATTTASSAAAGTAGEPFMCCKDPKH
jgi:hypothetical protein